MATADLTIVVTAKDQASKALNGIDKSAGGLGKTLGDVGKIAGGFLAANVIAGGVQKLTGFIGDSIAAVQESIQVNAQLDAVLKSTGGAAEQTAEMVKGLAAKLEKMTMFEDEAILKGQNLLLTFTNIKGDIFVEATKTMLDMAQALGTDAAGSAIQLGKALNDPIAGVSALAEVGVSFTEQQKEQIKAMVEAGDVAGAQVVILSELEKEFGGSAKAASDAAGSAETYKDKMNDLKETIGSKLLPIQLKFKEIQAEIIDFIVSKVLPVFEDLAAWLGPKLSAAFDTAKGVFQDIKTAIEQDVIAPVQDLIDLFTLGFEGGQIGGEFTAIQQAAFILGQTIKNDVLPFINDIREGFDKFILILKGGQVGGELSGIQQAFVDVAEAIKPVVDKLGELFSLIGAEKKEILIGIAAVIGTVLVGAFVALGLAAAGAAISVLLAVAPFIAVAAAIAIAVTAAVLIVKHWDELKAATESVFAALPGPVQSAMQFIHDDIVTRINGVIAIFDAMWQQVQNVVALISALVHGDWSAAWAALKDIVTTQLDLMQGVVETMFGSLPGIIMGLIGEASSAAGEWGKSVFNSIVNWLESLPGRLFTIGQNAASSFLSGLGDLSVAGISVNDVGGLLDNPFRAKGGPVTAGSPYIVGERGPEMFVPRQSGAIVPNSALGGGGISVQFLGPVTFGGDRAGAEWQVEAMAYSLTRALRARGMAV